MTAMCLSVLAVACAFCLVFRVVSCPLSVSWPFDLPYCVRVCVVRICTFPDSSQACTEDTATCQFERLDACFTMAVNTSSPLVVSKDLSSYYITQPPTCSNTSISTITSTTQSPSLVSRLDIRPYNCFSLDINNGSPQVRSCMLAVNTNTRPHKTLETSISLLIPPL